MVDPELRMLEIRSPEMQVQTKRKRACMYAGREQQRGRQLDGKARAGGRGQCRRASGERWRRAAAGPGLCAEGGWGSDGWQRGRRLKVAVLW